MKAKVSYKNLDFELIEKEITEIDIFNFRRIITPYEYIDNEIFLGFCNKEINKQYILMYIQYLCNSENIYFDELDESDFTLNDNGKVDKVLYSIVVYTFLRLLYCSNDNDFLKEIRENKGKEYIPIYEKYSEEVFTLECLKKDDKNIYYRGQSNYNWDIKSSILRKIDANYVLDFPKVKEVLSDFLVNYNALIDYNKDKSTYEKIAFAQHAVECSPLIDLTQSSIIATSFALSNTKDFINFKNIDSAIFKFEALDNDVIIEDIDKCSKLIEDLEVFNIDTDSICPGKKYYAFTVHNDKLDLYVKAETIEMDSFYKIIRLLVPRVAIFDAKTNDRMQYQKGAFLFFYGSVIALRGRIYYELSPDIKLIKYRIKCGYKRKILKSIHNIYQGYDIDNLMNPYYFFIK